MNYYHDLVTAKSWKLLTEFAKESSFILIGGWAVFLYTRALKSKDIDIIVPLKELSKLRERYEVRKNDRLKKYEISIAEIDIDIYVPHYSRLGLPIEVVQTHTQQIEGFTVPEREALLILKQHAWLDRGKSPKGEKDRIDIVALLMDDFDFNKYQALLVAHELESYHASLCNLVTEMREVPELNLNQHQYAALKRRVTTALI